ncbi:MAG: hypothetical protein QXP36_10860 [Conexivisphaerales archaeon]
MSGLVEWIERKNTPSKISVKEVLFELSKIYVIKNRARRTVGEIPDKYIEKDGSDLRSKAIP